MCVTMAEIEAAFPATICKGPLSCKTTDTFCMEGFRETEEYLKGKTWKDLVRAGYNPDLAETLHFISSEAFSVYAPAYFYWFLEDFEGGDCMSFSMVFLMARRPKQYLSELHHPQLVILRRILGWLDGVHGDEFLGSDRYDLKTTISEVENSIRESSNDR